MDKRRLAPFGWQARVDGPVLKIRFEGDLDLSVFDECEAALEQPLAGPERTVLLDLSGLTFIDSTGLRVLIHIKQTTDVAGKRLLLSGVPGVVARVLEVSGVTSWFTYQDSERSTPCPTCESLVVSGSTLCPSCGGGL